MPISGSAQIQTAAEMSTARHVARPAGPTPYGSLGLAGLPEILSCQHSGGHAQRSQRSAETSRSSEPRSVPQRAVSEGNDEAYQDQVREASLDLRYGGRKAYFERAPDDAPVKPEVLQGHPEVGASGKQHPEARPPPIAWQMTLLRAHR